MSLVLAGARLVSRARKGDVALGLMLLLAIWGFWCLVGEVKLWLASAPANKVRGALPSDLHGLVCLWLANLCYVYMHGLSMVKLGLPLTISLLPIAGLWHLVFVLGPWLIDTHNTMAVKET